MLKWQLQNLCILTTGTSLRSERKVTLNVKYIQFLELDPIPIFKLILDTPCSY